MEPLVLEAGNPYDIANEELEAFGQALRDRVPGLEAVVAPERQQRGVGVTWWEVVTVWVPWDDLRGAAAALFLKGVKDWVATRMQQRIEEGKRKEVQRQVRPIVVLLYDRHGRPLAKVEQGREDPRPRRVRPTKAELEREHRPRPRL